MPDRSLLVTLSVWLGQCLVFSGAGVAAQLWRRRLTGRGSTALEALLLGALAPCALGYLAFILYFAHPLAGRAFSWLSLAAIFGTLAHAYLLPLFTHPPVSQVSQVSPVFPTSPPSSHTQLPCLHTRLLALTALAGLFYLSALFVFPAGKFAATAGQRFLANMPGDNFIPTLFAERLFSGVSPRAPGGDWLSSDRPPLQAGLALVTLPALRALDIGYDKACATAGVWFQLLWIPALWLLLRWLGLTDHQAHAATAALVFTGFLLFNSVFVWPKLAAGALVLLAFCTVFATASAIDPRHRWITGAALAACGALVHSGVLFSLLALAPLLLWHAVRAARAARAPRSPLRSRLSAVRAQLLPAAAVFAVLVLPWLAYQRLYEPPGNRLVKWHLAGAIAPDSRGVLETLVSNYRALGWDRALATRRDNLRLLFRGDWPNLLATHDPAAIAGRRSEEIFHLFRTPATWILGAATLPFLAFLFLRRRPAWRDHVRRHALALAWLVLTLALWLALMFFPDGTMVHQGSYVVPLLLLGVLTAWTLLLSRRLFAALALLQLALFTLTWMPPSLPGSAVPQPFALAAAALSALVIATLAAESLFPRPPQRPAACPSHLGALFPAWSALLKIARSPRGQVWGAVIVAVLILVVRKSWALFTPQLWAEDGTIHLNDNDQLGLRAFFTPYRGYLHLLPRLIAWIASHTADVACWPAIYNGATLLITALLFARMASPRLNLPAKPWLVLAFILVAHSGEAFLNITNLHWLTGFFLVQQVLLARPQTAAQRAGDLVLVVLVGLTDPSAIIFLPLFVWRWWRDRHADNLALLLLVGACAATQAYFLTTAGLHHDAQAQPLHLLALLQTAGSRLIIWPFFGTRAVTFLPPVLQAVIALTVISALALWSARPHPRRYLRLQILAAWALISFACVYRIRPDTWGLPLDNLSFAEPYFYMSRLLLVWLVIWEFDTQPRCVAYVARTACLAGALLALPDLRVPAPPDYHWTEHCDPVRRGVPANIPTLPEGWTLEYRGRPDPK